MNPLKNLRDRLGLTRIQMGELLDLGASSIDKYESDMGEDTARRCAELARKHGYYDLVPSFNRLAGDVPKNARLDPEDWSPREREVIGIVIDIMRNPKTETDRSFPNLIYDLAQLRRKIGDVVPLKKPPRKGE